MSAPRTRRRLAGVAVALSLATTAAATAAPAHASPDAQPPGGAVTTHDGTLPDGATWVIDVPQRWNGTLLLFSHGLVPPGSPNPAADATDPVTAAQLLGEGYALAGSSFATTGWAAEDAIRDQRDLLDVVKKTIGAPKRTIAWGPSLGGQVSASLLEQYPKLFDGGLSLCGVLGGGIGLMNSYLDTLFAAKTLLAPDAPIELVHISDPFASIGAFIQVLDAAQATPEGRARIALAAALGNLPTTPDADHPFPPESDPDAAEQAQYQIMRDNTLFIGIAERSDVEQRSGGNPSWNTGVDYASLLHRSADRQEVKALYQQAGLDLGADLKVLAKAPRIAADPAAVKYNKRFTTFTGELRDPMLTIHTIGDPLVTVQHEQAYASTIERAGHSDLLRQAFTARGGHCTFSPAETVAAMHALLYRVEHGQWQQRTRPDQLNAAATALGPDLNVHFDEASGNLVPTPPAFASFHPSRFLRPFDRAGANVNPVIDRALPLWAGPIPADDDTAVAAFAEVYTDPVLVNGQPSPLLELVERARMLQAAFDNLEHELVSDVDSGDRCAFAFKLSGRHVGPLVTPLGEIGPTGRHLSVTGMDIFVLRDGRVAEIWALADMLGLLLAAGALTAPIGGLPAPVSADADAAVPRA